jgi:hypothetical protein
LTDYADGVDTMQFLAQLSPWFRAFNP